MVDVTGRGGAEKALVDLVLRLDRQRYNVSVCATRSAGNYQPLLDAAGVPTFIEERRTRWDLRGWASLAALLRRQKVHVLHTHLFGSNTLGRVLGRLAGVPVLIAHEHGSTIAPHEARIDGLLYRLSDRILVPSEASKKLVMQTEGIPGRRLTVLYNGVDSAGYAPAGSLYAKERATVRNEFGIDDATVLVGTVGRLSPEKGGVDFLIRAIAHLRHASVSNAAPAGAHVQLMVVGDGPLRPSLAQLSQEADAGVIFTGTRNDVARLLSAMDIFVLPSLKEAMPVALLEAMSAGLPAVATEVGGVPEIIRSSDIGLLVRPGDEASLRAVLADLVADGARRRALGEAGRTYVVANFSLDSMVHSVEQLYEEIAQRKMGASFPRRVTSPEARAL
ncbi:MAG: glycosyltransferase [Chloroflexota bacterium]|nr:glycosyltransferase [Chloroflexota bacterium]